MASDPLVEGKGVLPMNEMDVVIKGIHWLISLSLLAYSVFVIFIDASIFWYGIVRGEDTPYTIVFLGGSVGALGLLVLPVPGANLWWWLPFLLDWASLPFLIYVLCEHFGSHHKPSDGRKAKDFPFPTVMLTWFAGVAIPVMGFTVFRSSTYLEATCWTVGAVIIATFSVLGVMYFRERR